MVSPIHLLLFGARKVEYSEHLIVLDNWFVVIAYCYKELKNEQNVLK